MRLPLVFTIWRKEITETIRDRRTLLMVIGLPLVLYPLMILAMTRIQEARSEATEARPSQVAVWGEIPADMRAALEADAGLRMVSGLGLDGPLARGLESGALRPGAEVADRDERAGRARKNRLRQEPGREDESPVQAAARALVASRGADAVLVAWREPGAPAVPDGMRALTVYFDSVRDESNTAQERLADAIETHRVALLAAREAARGLPEGFVKALDVRRRDVAPAARRAGYVLGSFLPFVLVSLSLFGGFYPAVDQTAGEKERGTMQTLLCAPLRSTEIVMGKFLAVWSIALTTALVNVVSLAFTMARVMPRGDVHVPPSIFLLTALMLVPVTLTTTALFLAVAAFARDFRDGQNFLTPVYMLLILPAGVSMLRGIELDAWTAFVPIVNIALLVKGLLIGEVRPELVFLTLLASLAYATLAVLLAVRVFEREQVLLGSRDSARALLGLQRRHGGVPSPALALVAYAVVLVLAFYGSLLLESRGLLTTLLVTQYGFFLAPAVAIVVGLGFSVRDTFSWRMPPWQGVVAAVLLGASAWAGVGGLAVRIAPPPDSLVRALEKVLMLGDTPQPLWVVWFAVALTPALCEELFFRGLVLSGLRRLGAVPAIGISALLFGLAHASIYRLLPTLLLGIILGVIVWKTGSIACSMIVHALNNGLLATLTQSKAVADALGLGDASLSWPVTMVGLAATVAGLALLYRLRPPGPAPIASS